MTAAPNNKKSFRRVLIANRGEIAVRIARTLREMGITPVAIFSDADRIAAHVRACDVACRVGPAPTKESYLCGDVILAAAKRVGADAIHPGYGFLSENAAFAQAVEESGIAFIGPPAAAMRVMGLKTRAREAMLRAGVPCVPGSDGPVKNEVEAAQLAQQIGFPVMFKASAGGGGKGMRLVRSLEEVAAAYRAAASEALNAFGDASVYLEKAIIKPHHIEMQIFGGPDGKSVWLGERECSMQRRHQKVIEETPSAFITEELRQQMGQVACRAADAVGYIGAGTVEFLVDNDRRFYFLEMNTRLQVEHPVTELCCGVDLVEAQIRVAEGHALPWRQTEVVAQGHAIEGRIYAEDPQRGFMPCPGRIEGLELPQGPGIRVDCGVTAGAEVTRFYDPMIAKVAVWAPDREKARRKLHRALGELVVKGVRTNTSFLRMLLEMEAFRAGNYNTATIETALPFKNETADGNLVDIAIAAAAIQTYRRDTRSVRHGAATRESTRGVGWRAGPWRWRGG